jgi:hypothetical protein
MSFVRVLRSRYKAVNAFASPSDKKSLVSSTSLAEVSRFQVAELLQLPRNTRSATAWRIQSFHVRWKLKTFPAHPPHFPAFLFRCSSVEAEEYDSKNCGAPCGRFVEQEVSRPIGTLSCSTERISQKPEVRGWLGGVHEIAWTRRPIFSRRNVLDWPKRYIIFTRSQKNNRLKINNPHRKNLYLECASKDPKKNEGASERGGSQVTSTQEWSTSVEAISQQQTFPIL